MQILHNQDNHPPLTCYVMCENECYYYVGTLGSDVTLHLLGVFVNVQFRTSTLIMIPINLWQDSDPFKKKEHFSSSKIDRVRAFLTNLSKFQ